MATVSEEDRLRRKIAVLETELMNSNRRNAELAAQVRALTGKLKDADQFRQENIELRQEVVALRQLVSGAASPASPGSEDIAKLRATLASIVETPSATSYQPQRWQQRADDASTGEATEDAEIDRVVQRAADEAAVENREEAELEARIAKLRGRYDKTPN